MHAPISKYLIQIFYQLYSHSLKSIQSVHVAEAAEDEKNSLRLLPRSLLILLVCTLYPLCALQGIVVKVRVQVTFLIS